MNHNALIDRLIRIKDGLTARADRDAINDACAVIARERDAKPLLVGGMTMPEVRA